LAIKVGENAKEKGWDKAKRSVFPHLTLVGELGGGDIQLLVLLFQFRKLSLQLGLVQLCIVKLALHVLMLHLKIVVVFYQLTIGSIQSAKSANGLFSTYTHSCILFSHFMNIFR